MATANDREMFRQVIATMAYRAAKVLRDAPAGYPEYRVDTQSRTPLEILAHMGDLYDWALTIAGGEGVWHSSVPLKWNDEVARFYAAVKRFDVFVADASHDVASLDRLMHGPVADSLTHVGQLAMLRRLAGVKIRGENYFVADIKVGCVGPDQAPPRKEFE